MKRETQIMRVWRAYREGARCTPDVAGITGLSLKHCSAYTRELVSIGRLRIKGKYPRLELQRGKPALWYEPTK